MANDMQTPNEAVEPVTPPEHEAAVTTGDENAAAPKETDEEDISFDINELIDELDDVKEVEETPPPVEAKPEAKPEQPAQQEQPKQPEAPKQEVTEPQVQPPQEPQPVKEEPQPQQSAEDIQKDFATFFAKSVETLSDTVYQLPQEVAEQLDTEPSKVIPTLAATLHMQVLTAAVTKVANMLPALLTMERQRQTIVDDTEKTFYGQYKELEPHKDVVNRLAVAYRQVNPNATFEQAAPSIAAMAKVQLGLVDQPRPQPQEMVTQTPVIPTSVRGSSVPPAAPQGQMSQWEELIQED